MSIFFNTMPFSFFTLIMLAVMGIAIYEIIKTKREESQTHNRYIMYSLLFLPPILVVRRYLQENAYGGILSFAINICFVLGIIFLMFSLFYAWKKSRKYVDASTAKQQKFTLITIGLLMLFLIAFILIVYFFL